MKKRILFVINPVSGGRNKAHFAELASRNLDSGFDAEYAFSESVGHAHKLAREAVESATDIVVAVGGDGTINEVASAVAGTDAVMGIIPFGSGNGLARALHIPLKSKDAIRRINRRRVDCIDSGNMNGRNFFNMAGVGFDAHISSLFASLKGRGFSGYIKTAIREILSYQSQVYQIEIDGLNLQREAFMISVANSSQWGNNAHVAPKASLTDGLLDLCIIKPFPLYHFPVMVYHMFTKTADRSRYVEIIQGKKIRIVREKEDFVHLDGEPEIMGRELVIEVNPASVGILN